MLSVPDSHWFDYRKTIMRCNDGYRYRHQVQRPQEGMLLVDYLANAFPHSSSSQWAERILTGEIWIDERPAGLDCRIASGQVIVWDRPGWEEEETPQHFDILFEDSDVLAVNKPSGLPTIPGAGFYQNSLLMKVRTHYPHARPLHRLGRATSGIVLFGLNQRSVRALTEQWPSIRKVYRALAQGVAEKDRYEIDQRIGPIPHPRLGTVHAASSSGKRARSVATVLQRRAHETLFEIEIETGRPHQIRIHLASIGYPLVGDPLYGMGGLPIAVNPGLPGDGGYMLHAMRLSFSHPSTAEPIEVIAAPPAALEPSATKSCS
ncbi:MAG: RluA family pseudouridine synthase [Pirellula sp.]|nr:RluA family pseudouridine synthase [Pirellula sp.]